MRNDGMMAYHHSIFERSERVDQEELILAASEFQRTLMNYLSRQGMSVANLAEHTGYSPAYWRTSPRGRPARYLLISLSGLLTPSISPQQRKTSWYVRGPSESKSGVGT